MSLPTDGNPLALNPALWREAPGLPAVLAALGTGCVRLVGGAVRDSLLGLPVADIDLATTLSPDEVMQKLAAHGLKAAPTGLSHGTVTAIAMGHGYEVTTLRQDVATDGRHATVQFTDSWKADAARRDFTINALYVDPADARLHDYFAGLSDLVHRRVRFIGVPAERIAEDYLRILRFFRFSARFSPTIDADGLAATRKAAPHLKTLSMERVRDELLKLLPGKGAARVLAVMQQNDILVDVLPEISRADLAPFKALVAAEQQLQLPPAPLRRLASFLPPESAATVARRLKLSKVQRLRLLTLATRPEPLPPPAILAYRLGRDAAIDCLLLAGSLAPDTLHLLQQWERPVLPLRGKDLIHMGVPVGPEVSRTLAAVEEAWIRAGFSQSPTVVRTLAQQVIAETRAP